MNNRRTSNKDIVVSAGLIWFGWRLDACTTLLPVVADEAPTSSVLTCCEESSLQIFGQALGGHHDQRREVTPSVGQMVQENDNQIARLSGGERSEADQIDVSAQSSDIGAHSVVRQSLSLIQLAKVVEVSAFTLRLPNASRGCAIPSLCTKLGSRPRS